MDNLYVQESGTLTAPTIVFLHGGGVGGWMWRPQVESLGEYHCLVPDLPEHGRSLGVKPFTIQGAAAQIARLIRARANGGRAHVVGLSLGAQVGVALLGSEPEVVERAVLCSALVRPLPGAGLYNERLIAASYWAFIAPFKKCGFWIRLNQKWSVGVPPQYSAEFREDFQRQSRSSFTHTLVENLSFRLPTGLERAGAPVLAVVGEKEYGAMIASARDLAAALPNARACCVRHRRNLSRAEEHNWNLQEPELFNRMLRSWIEDRPLPQELAPLE